MVKMVESHQENVKHGQKMAKTRSTIIKHCRKLSNMVKKWPRQGQGLSSTVEKCRTWSDMAKLVNVTIPWASAPQHKIDLRRRPRGHHNSSRRSKRTATGFAWNHGPCSEGDRKTIRTRRYCLLPPPMESSRHTEVRRGGTTKILFLVFLSRRPGCGQKKHVFSRFIVFLVFPIFGRGGVPGGSGGKTSGTLTIYLSVFKASV